MKVLRIDSSAQRGDSITRRLGSEIVRRLEQAHPEVEVQVRDLSDGIGFIDKHWVAANLTDHDRRDPSQHEVLSSSGSLVHELSAADVIIVTAPVYNFSIPASLKAWIDMICRARLTFQYTENGPKGMLKDRPVYLVMASGGVPFGSPVDFASDYLRHIFGFIGIQDVRPVFAEQTNRNKTAARAAALTMLDQWLPGETVPGVA
ncbi:FMN-dependent NADH-azoreductase [Thiogranum longum]|uniref:FMN dependent NADH:quinone oxidoreductase n=1 Tax=Thiogranum longum TaxID=1537524 RepID=A0A4R1H6Z8_9GAMM|nr:NAD(P)H-dependent oxidoreductase [Thiogranum longum]TCK16938.1 FMN-dependent NADH-azoreductase [Thiogranum longum]